MKTSLKLTPAVRAKVAELLGREPRGLVDVPVLDARGEPRVIEVAPIVDGRPFPTLYWLVDPVLNYRIDQAEAGGMIARLQALVDQDAALRERMARDHRRHIERRMARLSEEERRQLAEANRLGALSERGIGGISDFSRIRCLHTWYAAHLVEANAVGQWLDENLFGQPEEPAASPGE